MEIAFEQLVAMVTQELVAQLKEQGVTVRIGASATGPAPVGAQPAGAQSNKSERIDMTRYKTPLLSEGQLAKLHQLTGTIIIPRGTIITPRAKEQLKEKNITVQWE